MHAYLTVTEAEEIRLAGAPRKTAALYETLLPYAVAMEAEHRWGERFDEVLARAVARGEYRQPQWYSGTRWDVSGAGDLATGLGDSLEAVAAAAIHSRRSR